MSLARDSDAQRWIPERVRSVTVCCVIGLVLFKKKKKNLYAAAVSHQTLLQTTTSFDQNFCFARAPRVLPLSVSLLNPRATSSFLFSACDTAPRARLSQSEYDGHVRRILANLETRTGKREAKHTVAVAEGTIKRPETSPPVRGKRGSARQAQNLVAGEMTFRRTRDGHVSEQEGGVLSSSPGSARSNVLGSRSGRPLSSGVVHERAGRDCTAIDSCGRYVGGFALFCLLCFLLPFVLSLQ